MNSPLSSKQQTDYQKLRQLLIGEVATSKIDRLTKDDIAYISSLISEAIMTRSNMDNSLSHALAPIVDSAFDRSIRKEPKKIADVFYPIIGPAIRKSVSAALFDMVQSLNQLLEQSLSVKSLSWRFKAWKAGKSYAEYALLKTLKYRVEQVFLIHRESGILINSVVAAEVVFQDPDLVSSMLTAINDFAADSFETENQSLEWLKFGELTLHIQVGPKAIMAIAVRGSSGKKVTDMLGKTLEKIHDNYYSLLTKFDGNKEQWQFITPTLESCLISKTHIKQNKKKPWLAIVIIFIGLTYLAIIQYKNYNLHQQKNRVVALANNNNNYFYVSDELKADTLTLTLIKDYHVNSFENELKTLSLKDLKVKLIEIPLALNTHKMMLPYIHSLTQSPATLELSIDKSKLVLSGKATKYQTNRITQNPILRQYFSSIDSHLVETIETEHQLKHEQFYQLYNQLNGQSFLFEKTSISLSEKQSLKLGNAIKQLKIMYQLANELNKPIQQLSLIGFTDRSGTLLINRELSLERADNIRALLVANNIPENDIIIRGEGFYDSEKLDTDQQRRVTLMVYYNEN
jgi:OOP family OmpA-OmpF porin